MSAKIGKDFKYTPEEKERILKKYFMKYYMENAETPMEIKQITLADSQAAKSRVCSCTVGEYNEKTGELIPPYELAKNKLKRDRVIEVALPPDFTT